MFINILLGIKQLLTNYGRRHFKIFTNCFVRHPVLSRYISEEVWFWLVEINCKLKKKSLLLMRATFFVQSSSFILIQYLY